MGQRLLHDLGEEIDFLERGVNVGSNPDPGELTVIDRNRYDSVFRQEMLTELGRLNSLDLHQRNAA